MTPDLIAFALALPQPVRDALLDVDPTGVGWYLYGLAAPALTTRDSFRRPVRASRLGAVWLPCNPLAIVERAAIERGLDCAPSMSRTSNGWRFALVVEGQHGQDVEVESASGPCPYTAAIGLLQKVLSGAQLPEVARSGPEPKLRNPRHDPRRADR